MRMLQVNSLVLLGLLLIPISLFPSFHFSMTTFLQLGVYRPALSEIELPLKLYFAFDARRTQPKMH